MKDVRPFEINYSNPKYISKQEAQKLDKRCKPKYDDILLTKVGATYGFASVVKSKEIFQIFVSLALLRPNQKYVLPDFLAIVLNSNFIYLQFQRVIKGAGVPDLHLEDIRKIQIPLPPLPIQEKIVDIFEQAYQDKKAKESEAQNLLGSIDGYLLEKLGISPQPERGVKNISPLGTKGLYFMVNFSKVQGKRLDPFYHQKEFEELEKALENGRYEIISFSRLAKKITSGATPTAGGDAYTDKNSGIPFIRSGEINEFDEIDFDKTIYIKPEVHQKMLKSSQLQKNDLMIAIVGATIGQVGVFKHNIDANINQAIALVRFDKRVDIEFVKSFLRTNIGQKVLDRLKRPVARANINLDEVASIKIPLPPLEIQNEIAEHIQEMRTQAKQLEAEASEAIAEAKRQVETMILGNEN